ncbi:MAG TPA: universal stress protein [Gemmataceae bacterium]|nr:universal stress protein [Gemmataceae bacterium]
MLPIHTILHPTDFSDRSHYALHLAGALARDYGAGLMLLHVIPQSIIGYGEGVIPPDPDVLLEEARADLDRLIVPDLDTPVWRRTGNGDPAATILRVARETNTDLIVMGTHGRTGLSRLLMGSVAEQVVRRASCPVMTVKTPFPTSAAAQAAAAEAMGVAGPM